MRIIVGGVLAALVAAAIGCGSGGDNALTQAEFIKQGDEICQAAKLAKGHAIEKFVKGQTQENSKSAPTPSDTGIVTAGLPSLKKASEQLEELASQVGEQEAMEVVDALKQSLEGAEQNPTAALKGESFTKSNEVAEQYGFETCSTF